MKKLTPEEERIILLKGTEAPFSGKYYRFNQDGTYSCKQCGALLYNSSDKFDSGCGWPSFDDEIAGAIKRLPDADGRRTEILCAKCDAHLGHVFRGEALTSKNIRHCVNSISLDFIPKDQTMGTLDEHLKEPVASTETAIFAGGCFWGVEYLMKHLSGVISVISGYIGGNTPNPTYQDVCNHRTGHAEAVQITFDPRKVTYEALVKRFFEIHDPEQVNKQGSDVGDQYRSEIFYTTAEQKEIALKLIGVLRDKGFQIATKLTPATKFWKAEDYHQNYYEKTNKQPYCHQYIKKF